MTSDKAAMLSGLTTRQKVMAGVFVVIVLVLIWQVAGMFGSAEEAAAPPPVKPAPAMNAMGAAAPGSAPAMSPQGTMPPVSGQLAQKKPEEPLSPREAELMKLQQETEAKYIAALNELQMLKVQREIAENTKAISTAKLDTVKAQKGIVDLLTKPEQTATPEQYAQGLVAPTPAAQPVPSSGMPVEAEPKAEVTYTVISVSQLQYKWNAVLGYKGRLYSVSTGDVLPADGSKVISIDKSGVVLEKDGTQKKLSMVPII